MLEQSVRSRNIATRPATTGRGRPCSMDSYITREFTQPVINSHSSTSTAFDQFSPSHINSQTKSMAFAQYDAFLNDGSTWGREWRFVDPPSYGWARYITAVRFNQTALLARLIQKSTKEVNVVGLDGRSALHVAALSGDYVEVGRLLLDAGEDPSIRTRLGDDALVYAERYGRTRLASLLRDAMAKRLSTAAQPASSMPLRLSPRHLPPRVRMRRRYGSTTNTSRDALPRVDTFRNSTQRAVFTAAMGVCYVQGQCVCYGNGTGFDCSERPTRALIALPAWPEARRIHRHPWPRGQQREADAAQNGQGLHWSGRWRRLHRQLMESMRR